MKTLSALASIAFDLVWLVFAFTVVAVSFLIERKV